MKKHTDKIATSILRGEYADYDKHWWHYDKEYNMLLKAQTEAFKLANDAAEQQDKEAIDTVLKEVEKPLPTEDEAGTMATSIASKSKPNLTAQEEAFFVAGFIECVNWMRYLREEETK